MNQTLAVWLLIALALVSANLPFLTERVFAVLPWKQAGQAAVKPFWLRLVEVLVFYGRGRAGFRLRVHAGQPFLPDLGVLRHHAEPVLVLAYPGFVYRYLFKRHPRLRS